MDRQITGLGGVSATTTDASSSNAESRVNLNNVESNNGSSSSTRDPFNEIGEGSNSSNNTGNEGSGANVEETENQSGPGRRRPLTLGDVIREPGSRAPDVMVLESMPEESNSRNREAILNPKEDLWLSTADGRYNSTMIPLLVGEAPRVQTFYVHKQILLKVEYFKRALCGSFRESETQSIELPEEDPETFHFLVAFLYEGKYEPLKPAASALVADQQKGKGRDSAETNGVTGGIDSENNNSEDSDLDTDLSAAPAQRQRERQRRRQQRERQREWDRVNGKHPGRHRPNCGCPRCVVEPGPPCWSCHAPRSPVPPPGNGGAYTPTGTRPPFPPGPDYHHRPYLDRLLHEGLGTAADRRRARARLAAAAPPPPPPPPPPADSYLTEGNTRLTTAADLRTWLLCYEHTLSVYILANKFLLDDFKAEIARHAIDLLESAGTDAAVPQVLFLCKKLWEGLPESDPLLKMVFARVGFLQPWRSRRGGYTEVNRNGKRRRSQDGGMGTAEKEMDGETEPETGDWLHQNPEIVTAVLMEMAARREEDFYHTQYNHQQGPGGLPGPPGMGGYMGGMGGIGGGMGMGRMDAGGRSLPSMERPWATAAGMGGGPGGGGRGPNGMPGALGGDMGTGPMPWVNHWDAMRPGTMRPGPMAHHHWQFGR
ncbi:hypothetical protein B0T20DRAFT_438724 [Sordaria brevicollis]|uniref:BTB domain-containing protein n=1 Tax=Sordaria brevicollis TaxID=83679 RepID=A0AAE0UB59_SORBR|nr:hypothetical protein B0T20DRAFT_438724 [Sordaria brevicollis]